MDWREKNKDNLLTSVAKGVSQCLMDAQSAE